MKQESNHPRHFIHGASAGNISLVQGSGNVCQRVAALLLELASERERAFRIGGAWLPLQGLAIAAVAAIIIPNFYSSFRSYSCGGLIVKAGSMIMLRDSGAVVDFLQELVISCEFLLIFDVSIRNVISGT